MVELLAELARQTSHIRLDLRGPVLHLWLDRPELRNAISAQMVREMLATFAAIAEDQSVRVVVLRGAGGTFCAGGDIKSMAAAYQTPPPGAPDELKENNRRFGAMLDIVNTAPQAVIAAVEGHAMGGGFGLACVADITIATADAKFGMTEVTIGVVPAAISPFVVKRIGLTAARRLAVSGARLDGSAAAALGIAHRTVADAAALDAAVRDSCNQILKCAPGAVAATKLLMLRAAGPSPMPELLDAAADSFVAAVRGPEGREGTRSFVEKRQPSWVTQVSEG
ncbi:MAG TPA: enoyl-CoA hydratase-related protein [Xanthobacteraceae bacterium]|nr:enoyl-CoA hydratase-related protein [Xanthobacteraceae bacterium]